MIIKSDDNDYNKDDNNKDNGYINLQTITIILAILQ
jgi:hypothetical protein